VEGNGVWSVGLEENGRCGFGLRVSTRIVGGRSVGRRFLRSDWLGSGGRVVSRGS
jgi:hypothetical protein